MTNALCEPTSSDISSARRSATTRLLKRASFLLLLSAACLGAATHAQAEDARAILQRTANTYQGLTSYAGDASVTTALISEGKTIRSQSFTAYIKYKRPNKLRLEIIQPRGTNLVISDGSTLLVYDALAKQYGRGPSAPDMKGLLPLLFTRAGIAGLFDPLYFMGHNQLPPELGSPTSKADTTINGHPVYVITAVTHTRPRQFKMKDGKTLTIPASTRFWTWWINKQTHLIEKLEFRSPSVPMKARGRQGKQIITKTLQVSTRTRHVIMQAKANGPVEDSAFAFTPPPGATERKSFADLMGGK